MSASILWHDYETWGVNPKFDFPVQFAAIRTDLDLNPIDKPINYFCQIPNDYLPHPQACLITGITPQQSIRDGSIEAEFAAKVYAQLSAPESCSAGYNSLKFDEEVSRNLLYRNFYPVYEREYEHGNSRWDVIDLVRAAYALRPEGIEWPMYEDGKPCFKLERLSLENKLEHAKAHDALSDVYATIAIAKLIKEKQTKLYEYYWQLRDKHFVLKNIDLETQQPFVLVSGFISSAQGCCSWMMPVSMHQNNRNAVLSINLSRDISVLEEYSIEQLQDQDLVSALYQERRIPLMQIAINKVPFVAKAKMLSPENAQRLGIDREQCLANLAKLKAMPDLAEKCKVLSTRAYGNDEDIDVDAQLYTRDFPSPADKQLMSTIRNTQAEALSQLYASLDGSLYKRQLFRFMGRNYPNLMSENQVENWQAHRRERLLNGLKGQLLSIDQYQQEIAQLAQQNGDDANKLAILRQLENYAAQL